MVFTFGVFPQDISTSVEYLAVFAFGVWPRDTPTSIWIHIYSLHTAFGCLLHITTLGGTIHGTTQQGVWSFAL